MTKKKRTLRGVMIPPLAILTTFLFFTACSNLIIDLGDLVLESGENIVFAGTDGSDLIGEAIDTDEDGIPEGLDLNGDGSIDFTFVTADSQALLGLYAADTDGDGITDIYIQVSSTGASSISTSADNSGAAVTFVVAADGTMTFSGAEISTVETSGTSGGGGTDPGTDPGSETPVVAATTDINGDGNIDATDTVLLGQLSFTVTNGTASITGADESISGLLNIPSSYDGIPVTSIANSALGNCTGLTSVVIPEGITYVGFQSFVNCSGLTSISFPASLTSLEPAAFEACTSLTSITLPTGITAIYNSFNDCTALTSVTIPSNITTIGMSAFDGCSALTSLTIPASVSVINSGAFEDCTALTSLIMLPKVAPITATDIFDGITSPVSLTYPEGASGYDEAGTVWLDTSVVIKDGDVDGDGLVDGDDTEILDELTFSLLEGEYSLTDVDRYLTGTLIIPSTHEGLAVTSIGDNAFSYCSSLTSIVLPSSIVSIGDSAFNNCSSLESLSLLSSVAPTTGTTIFSTLLDSINIRYSSSATGFDVSPWEEYLVGDVNGDYLVDSDDVTKFENLTFAETSTEVILTGCSALIFDSLQIPGRVNGKTVVEIGSNAFKDCTGLNSIVIPESVTTIGSNAFDNCTNLKAFTMLASTAPNLGTEVFSDITEAYLSTPTDASGYDQSPWNDTSVFYLEGDYNGDGSIDTDDDDILDLLSFSFIDSNYTQLLDIGTTISGKLVIPRTYNGREVSQMRLSVADGCTDLTSVVIPNSVTVIGRNTFKGCSSLTSVTFPSKITELPESMFESCCALTTIDIPGTIETIGKETFLYCIGLTSVNFESGVTSIGERAFGNCIVLPSVTLPDTVTSIGDYAFNWCFELESVTLPSVLETIGSYAFNKCSALSSLNIPGSVTSIDTYAFYECTELVAVTFSSGSSLTTIGDHAFASCEKLPTISIPDSVTSLGDYTFEDCSNLISISLPLAITTIGDRTFYNCVKLESITIPENVTTIGPRAFTSCSLLETVYLPASITSLELYAFAECTSLSSLTIAATTAPTVDMGPFTNVSGCTLYYPANADIDSYTLIPWTNKGIFSTVTTY